MPEVEQRFDMPFIVVEAPAVDLNRLGCERVENDILKRTSDETATA